MPLTEISVCVGQSSLILRFGKFDRVRISDVQHDLVALLGYLVTDAVDDQRFGVTFRHADDHIVQQRPVQAVLGFEFFAVVRPREGGVSASTATLI